jgi:hypothetical protein
VADGAGARGFAGFDGLSVRLPDLGDGGLNVVLGDGRPIVVFAGELGGDQAGAVGEARINLTPSPKGWA